MKELDRNEIITQADAVTKAQQRSKNRITTIKKYLYEKHTEELNEMPLSINKEYRVKIELSTGGDADGFILNFNDKKELVGGVFYWADWDKYAETELSFDEAELINDAFSAHLLIEE